MGQGMKLLRPRFKIDWERILLDLQAHSYGTRKVAESIHIPVATVHGWKNLDAEPRYSDGTVLIALWAKVTGKQPKDVPIRSKGIAQDLALEIL